MRRRVAIFLVCLGILFSFPQSSDAQWVQAKSPKGGWITDLLVRGTNIFAATREGGVFLSTDNGVSWTAVNSGLPKKIDVQCLAASGTNIFAGTVEHGVFLSTNNGASWTAINSGLPAKSSIFSLAVSGTNLFAVAGAKQPSVFLSTDNGMNWTAANSGLPDHEVLCLAVIGTNIFAGTGNVWAGKYGGVFGPPITAQAGDQSAQDYLKIMRSFVLR